MYYIAVTEMLNFILGSCLSLTSTASVSSITTSNTLSGHDHPSRFLARDITSTDLYTTEQFDHFGRETNTRQAFEAVNSETGGTDKSIRKTYCGPILAGPRLKSPASVAGVTSVSGVTDVSDVPLVSSDQLRWKSTGFQLGWANETTASQLTQDKQSQTTTLFITATETEEEDPFAKELISPEAYGRSKVHTDKLGVFLCILAFGINLLNVVVLSRKGMRSPSTPFLIALAVAEFSYVFVGFVREAVIDSLPETSYFFLIYVMFVVSYGNSVSLRFTYCLTTLVCLERFFALTFPLKASHSRLIKSPLLVILTSLLVLLLVHLEIVFRYEVYLAQTLEDGEEIYTIRPTRIYAANTAVMDAWGHAVRVVFVFLMLLLSLVMNVFLVVVLQRHGRSRQGMGTNDNADKRKRQEREITVTILVSTTVFILLSLPQVTNATLVKLIPEQYSYFSPRCHTFLFVGDIGTVLSTLSFCTDFLAYFIFNSSFRRTLGQILWRAVPYCIAARFAPSWNRKNDAKVESSSMDTKHSDFVSTETHM